MIFLDANVLVAFLDNDHVDHDRTCSWFDAQDWSVDEFAISPQIVGETFVTLTSSRYRRDPITADGFRSLVQEILANPSVTVLRPGNSAIDYALNASVKLDISSARIYDLIIYGTMLEHGITKIATFNVKHFRGLEGIELVEIP